MVILLWRTLLAVPRSWRQRDKIFDQFFEIGNASLLMALSLATTLCAAVLFQPALLATQSKSHSD